MDSMSQAATPEAPVFPPLVSYEEFLRLPPDVHSEWVEGKVVFMPSVTQAHDALTTYLVRLIGAFLEERPLGRLFKEPFQLFVGRGRAPDVMVLLAEHMGRLQTLYIDGAADLVIEVVSPSRPAMDYVEKFREYEAAGVPEYWILDPERQVADFFRLGPDGRYQPVETDDGTFRSKVLLGFWIRVAWLWEFPAVRRVLAEILDA